jgi:hypothetical protein
MMGELIAHLTGDYVLQNHWMANRKTSSSLAAAIHVFFYTLPFLLLSQHWQATSVIAGTHFVIDRFRLAKYWVHFWGVGNTGWVGRKLGLDVAAAPDWLAVWLLIIVDNTAHLAINHASILWL